MTAADVEVDTPAIWGEQALQIAEGAQETITELDPHDVAQSVRARLRAGPIEDLRIDLEDGYG